MLSPYRSACESAADLYPIVSYPIVPLIDDYLPKIIP
jgi:hypothetical protein